MSTASTVSAVLLDSKHHCAVEDAYATLNTDWSQYGSVPLTISTGGALCTGTFTLGDLEASGADTVVMDTTGGYYQLTTDEVTALQEYLQQGHTLLGVGDDFAWHKINDNAVAPLLGLAEQSAWRYDASAKTAAPTYTLSYKNPAAATLFRAVPNPYPSAAAGFDEKPNDKRWSKNDLAGAHILAVNSNRHVAITYNDTMGYPAIYIANDADLQSTPADLQVLYNALIYPKSGE